VSEARKSRKLLISRLDRILANYNYRHGTLSLYAALNVKTGKVEGKTAKRHTSAEFIAFLKQLLIH